MKEHLYAHRPNSTLVHNMDMYTRDFAGILEDIKCMERLLEFGQDFTAFPLVLASLLALVCGWLVYTSEQSAFMQGQSQKIEYHLHGELTKREREVLTLMCRGYTQEKIADVLNIVESTVVKHRQHIYNQLGVHSEQDALMVAYHAGLVSLLEEIVPRRNS